MKKYVILLLLCGVTAGNDNWPQWRGPSLDGTSDSEGLPLKWSEEKNVKWKVKLPSWSGSTPAIWGDKIFLASAGSADDGESPTTKRFFGRRKPVGRGVFLFCLSKKDGKEIWKK